MMQKQTLMEGKPLYLEGMTSAKGKEFSATVQFNADKRFVEFLFDRTNGNQQAQNTQQGNQQTNQQSQPQEAPKTFRGKELENEQYDKFKAGQTIYVELKDKKTNRIRVISLSTKIPERQNLSFPVSIKHG